MSRLKCCAAYSITNGNRRWRHSAMTSCMQHMTSLHHQVCSWPASALVQDGQAALHVMPLLGGDLPAAVQTHCVDLLPSAPPSSHQPAAAALQSLMDCPCPQRRPQLAARLQKGPISWLAYPAFRRSTGHAAAHGNQESPQSLRGLAHVNNHRHLSDLPSSCAVKCTCASCTSSSVVNSSLTCAALAHNLRSHGC